MMQKNLLVKGDDLTGTNVTSMYLIGTYSLRNDLGKYLPKIVFLLVYDIDANFSRNVSHLRV